MEVGQNVQAVFGPRADALKTEINAALARGPRPGGGATVATEERPSIDGADAGTTTGAGATAGTTAVLAPVPGRVVALTEVADETFARGTVGHGAAIDPPRGEVDAVAPVGGRLVRLMPHAFVILTPEGVGVLVHLGLDTVQLDGEGFTTHVSQGDEVAAGDRVVTVDVAAVEAGGRDPVTVVVVMDSAADQVALDAAVGAEVDRLDPLLTRTR